VTKPLHSGPAVDPSKGPAPNSRQPLKRLPEAQRFDVTPCFGRSEGEWARPDETHGVRKNF